MLLQSSSTVLPFIGSEVDKPYHQAQVVILPIPYETTTTYRQGCKYGPASLLEASDQLEYYDIELDWEICWDVGIYTHPPIADSRDSPLVTPEEMLRVTKEIVSSCKADSKFVIALGGEHSITAAVVQGYQDILQESFTVVQIDAHGDLRYEYEGSIYNHACVMRRIRERGLPTLGVGIRSICAEEAQLIKEQQIPVVWAREIATQENWLEEAIAKISTPKVFITIDLDGLDPSLIPGVGTPEPGGLNWYSLTSLLRQIFATHEVIGCDVMELAPLSDSVVSQFSAAKLVYKLIGYHAFYQNN
ncbi:MAG: agmatinase [Spirulinaceae cyanobacterium]